jgi:Rnl2 family RNA ligase
MENDYQILKFDIVQEILQSNSESIEFVALEKIHGTNFSFITDGMDISSCRRSAILKPDESFYSSQKILSTHKDKILSLFVETKKYIKNKYNQDIIQIQLYGELYGGIYPNAGIEIIKDAKIVQKGVYYSNSNEFSAFDLKYWIKNDSSNSNYDSDSDSNSDSNPNNNSLFQTKYLDWDDFENILSLETVSIRIVPIISKGNWEILSQLNPKFESVVYQLHNLPKIPSNYAEGYVIKPIKEIRYGKNQERLIWKFKNPSFLEVCKNSNENISNTESDQYLLRLKTYINENRYDNVRSKFVDDTHVDKVVELFYSDVLVDFMDDLTLDNIELNPDDKKKLEKKLKGFANKFVRTRYIK